MTSLPVIEQRWIDRHDPPASAFLHPRASALREDRECCAQVPAVADAVRPVLVDPIRRHPHGRRRPPYGRWPRAHLPRLQSLQRHRRYRAPHRSFRAPRELRTSRLSAPHRAQVAECSSLRTPIFIGAEKADRNPPEKSGLPYLFRTYKKKAPGVSAKCLIFKQRNW